LVEDLTTDEALMEYALKAERQRNIVKRLNNGIMRKKHPALEIRDWEKKRRGRRGARKREEEKVIGKKKDYEGKACQLMKPSCGKKKQGMQRGLAQ
jgi:hypothetical protein